MNGQGYQPPNHTQVPNDLLDEHLKTMSESELKVVLWIVRKTLGWHKRRDKISLSQLMEATGLSRTGVVDGIEKALAHDLILRVPDGQSFAYELNVWEPELVANSYQSEKATGRNRVPEPVAISDQSSIPEVVANSYPQKKLKEKLKKEQDESDLVLAQIDFGGAR